MRWEEIATRGEKLPGSVVDNSTVVYDSRRDRLLFFRKGYGERHRYDGEIHALEWNRPADSAPTTSTPDPGVPSLRPGSVAKSRLAGTVAALSPKGMAAAAAIPYLCQIRYDAADDLLLVGATLPRGEDGLRLTPAYDCGANEWISLRIAGEDPSGKKGRNVSLGLMYDAARRLFWAVDTDSRVYVLRLDPATADRRALR
jgi:hypothetical protein